MTNDRCKHGLAVCSQCITITDAAKRMTDAINAKIVFHGIWDIRNSWMRFRLQDGWTDGAVYDTKQQAVRHCDNEKYYAFFCFRNAVGGVNPFDCQVFLEVNRHQYDIGRGLSDPDAKDGGPDKIVSTFGYDLWTQRPRDVN
jgi:hypothetical protein